MRIDDWFLTDRERGNPATTLPTWCGDSLAEPLIHGSAYFARLKNEIDALGEGDHLFFTDWRGDPDERMTPGGPSIREVFTAAAERGVIVKGLVWRSHLDTLQYSEEENRHLGEYIEKAGGEVLLDQRVRIGGSHHQKLVVLRHPSAPDRDVAFAGGIDLCHSRHDDAAHLGDSQPVRMAKEYGGHPPWHDVQLMVRGPVVGALDLTFRERWQDRTALDARSPLAYLRDRLLGADLDVGKLPPPLPDPPPAGEHLIQVLRTYPRKHPPYPFAPDGERSIARAYIKALRRARRLIYVEDQYLWSAEIAGLFAQALRAHPELHLVAVVPRHADVDGRFALPPNQVGRVQALAVCREAASDRVHVFDVENHAGTPVYVHAKVCVVDDVWATVGSDNLNRRSWSHDSELCCAVLDPALDGRAPADPGGLGDGARVFARDLRLRLLREHLDRDSDDDDGLLDPVDVVKTLEGSAQALQDWHEGGRVGPRPPGRLRPHRPEQLPRHTELWALPAYRLVYDPDGRPRRLRAAGAW